MKNFKPIIPLFSVLLTLYCCHIPSAGKRGQSTYKGVNPVLSKMGYRYNALIYVHASNFKADYGVGAGAKFYGDSNVPVPVGTLWFNEDTVKMDQYNTYNLAHNYHQSRGKFPAVNTIHSYFSKPFRIRWDGALPFYKPFDTTIQLPEPIQLLNQVYTGYLHREKESDIKVNWVQGTQGKPMQMRLEISWSPLSTPIKRGYISNHVIFVKDNGNYTIPAGVISKFDPSGSISIQVYRESEWHIMVSGKMLEIRSFTMETAGTFRYLN